MKYAADYFRDMGSRCTATYILLAACTCASSCDKEREEYCSDWSFLTTMEPQPYLPIYPGSSWTYSDTAGNTIVKAVSGGYVPHHFQKGSCRTHTALVPQWDGYPMYGYDMCVETTIGSSEAAGATLMPLLKDEPTGSWWFTYSWAGHSTYRKVIARDTTLTVGGNTFHEILVVADISGDPSVNDSPSRVRYYANNIGMVREDVFHYPDPPRIYELVAWSINN